MSGFDEDRIQILNKALADALVSEHEVCDKETYLAASNVVKFWSEFLYEGSSLYKAEFQLLREIDEVEVIHLNRALAVNRIANSDFWNGQVGNLSKIPEAYQKQILKAAELILDTSRIDSEYFGETS